MRFPTVPQLSPGHATFATATCNWYLDGPDSVTNYTELTTMATQILAMHTIIKNTALMPIATRPA